MKPLKLVMSGFGPFADREEIQFEEKGLDGVFLITGDTGSGKTTIFDAISFALYGEASGEWRSSEGFRSGYAEEETKTFVEMSFLQKGKKYCVKRNPEYQRPSKRGQKLVKEKQEAVLEYADGTTVSGVRQVNEAIQELIGIDRKQFKQVAMIAQGEFLSLLTANSKERGEILRKVFETENFKILQQKLSEKESEYAKKCERQDQNLLQIMQGIKMEYEFPEMEKLLESRKEKKIQETEKWLDDLVKWERGQEGWTKKRIEELEEEIQRRSKEIEHARYEEKAFLNFEMAKKELEKLEEEEERQQDQKEMLEAAKKAVHKILPLEKRWKEEKENQRYLEQQVQKQEAALQTANVLHRELERERQHWEEEKQKEEEKERQIVEFEEKKPIREKKRRLGEEKRTLIAKKAIFQEKIENVVKKQEKLLLEQQKLIQCEKEEEGAEQEAEICRTEIKELEKKRQEIWNLWKEKYNLDTMQHKEEKLLEEYEKKRKEWENQNQNFQETEKLFFGNLAGILAKELKENKPCPVCGSTHHPHKAQIVHSAVTEEEWEQLREENEKQRNELYEKKTDFERKKIETKSKKEEFLNKLSQLMQEVLENEEEEKESDLQGEKYQEELEHLEEKNKELLSQKKKEQTEWEERLKKKKEAQKRVREISEDLPKYQKEEKLLREQETEYEKQIWLCQQNLDEIEKKYPDIEEMREEEEEKIEILKQEIELSKKKREDIQERQQAQKDEQIRLQTILDAKKTEYEIQIQNTKKYEKNWISAYQSEGFATEELYRNALKSEEEIKDLEKFLEKSERKKNDWKAKIKVMEEQLSSGERKDVSELEQKAEEIKKEKQKYQDIYQNLSLRVDRNCEIQREIEELIQAQKKDRCLYGKYKELSDTANGRLKGKEKLAFEQYVQRFYFRQVVQKANYRFHKMSGGQYELHCMEYADDNKRSAGLDLEIMDYYTGKMRSVKSLSGGESFQAALALALGLSDVIQSYAGGIDVDAVFIDEGFGSLDVNALEQAVKVLTDLSGENRMVGIISHVSELKERIEKKVELTKTMAGSSITVKEF